MKTVSKLLLLIALFVISDIMILSTAYAEESPSETFIITSESTFLEIQKIQTLLSRLGVYSGSIDGNYDSIKKDIIDIQIQLGIVTDDNTEKAGKIDEDFLKKIRTKYASTFQKDKYEKVIEDNSKNKNPDLDSSGNTQFIVTAYYSPLPGQKRYATGSYRGDTRLNGNGTHGASGAAVHDGFIAAPKNYDFGTKIYLEGLGVGIVEDRGGAIVNAGVRGYEHDRLDVWMGYGDEGLDRALQWGKKTVTGKVMEENTEVTVKFSHGSYPSYYNLKVTPDSEGESVKELQELLKKVGAYNGNIDGRYKSVESSLLAYQKKNGIIDDKDSWGAGYFGQQTLTVVMKDMNGQIQSASPQEAVVIEEKEGVYLTREEKVALKSLKTKLDSALNIKAKGNTLMLRTYNKKIKERLEIAINRTSDIKKKEKLKYLQSIL